MIVAYVVYPYYANAVAGTGTTTYMLVCFMCCAPIGILSFLFSAKGDRHRLHRANGNDATTVQMSWAECCA